MDESMKIRLMHATVNTGIFLVFFAVMGAFYMPDSKGAIYSLSIAGFTMLTIGLTTSYRAIVVHGRK